jgi:diaminopimelate epimerase
MQPQFTKFHGLGNDYLVLEAQQLGNVENLGEFARRICNRHYGAGGDGIAIIGQPTSDEADFSCRIFNPDGSEAGLSGNGTRCAVAYLYYKGLWSGDELRLSTKTGLKRYFLRGRPEPGKFSVRVGVRPAELRHTVNSDVDNAATREGCWLSIACEWRKFFCHCNADGQS